MMISAGDDASSSHLSQDVGEVKEPEESAESVNRSTNMESSDGIFLLNRPAQFRCNVLNMFVSSCSHRVRK